MLIAPYDQLEPNVAHCFRKERERAIKICGNGSQKSQ